MIPCSNYFLEHYVEVANDHSCIMAMHDEEQRGLHCIVRALLLSVFIYSHRCFARRRCASPARSLLSVPFLAAEQGRSCRSPQVRTGASASIDARPRRGRKMKREEEITPLPTVTCVEFSFRFDAGLQAAASALSSA